MFEYDVILLSNIAFYLVAILSYQKTRSNDLAVKGKKN